MSIELMKVMLKQIPSSNIVGLISDILIPELENIQDFKTTNMYYKDDIVYFYDSENKTHNLYICIKDIVQAGAFNPNDWKKYSFNNDVKGKFLTSKFIASNDNTTICQINQPLFEADRDTLNVYHCINGRLSKDVEWELCDDGTSIKLLGFTLYKNEYIIFEVFK